MSRFESRNARYASADINERGGGERRRRRRRKRNFRAFRSPKNAESETDVSYRERSRCDSVSYGFPLSSAWTSAIREEIDRFYIYIYIFFSSRPFFFFLLSFLAIRLYNRYSYLGHERQPPPSLLFPLSSVSPRFVKHLFGTIKTRRPRSNGAGRTTSMYDTRIETYRQLYAHPPATPTLIPSI